MQLKELLNVALRIESDGYEMYSRLAEENEGELQKLFKELAIQEREHQQHFKKIFDKCMENEKEYADWTDDENAGYLMAFAELSIFPKLSGTQKPENINDAIDMAIEVEKDSILFYSDLKSYFKSKQTIDQIITEEKTHLMDLLRSRK
ncbi:MAG TPA: ferritin family protein [Thermotogota bacterium]|nr:ferritin family protein [Thermotogota bacterium]HRW33832.1 ferritin family protein [Thermotogota bacterium]